MLYRIYTRSQLSYILNSSRETDQNQVKQMYFPKMITAYPSKGNSEEYTDQVIQKMINAMKNNKRGDILKSLLVEDSGAT